ncbi:MAG: Co2+/Mg2+ efflux protein ApaG [Myxococcales bacterium]|nr:Co2+/Mg2+ efflux protein ApaG [Myxococcales bacterium]MCA9701935.1 Co2+/Mg2+ efflux protein ApaG [Myxococcales bacterium]
MPDSSQAISRNIEVRVHSHFVPQRSRPEEGLWFFAYHVELSNVGQETVQLLSRHWVITDGEGRVEEVRGPGVVGEQPVLLPGERFEYTSACPLPTPFGTMHGTYQMISEGGERFDAKIAPFSLSLPNSLH